MNALRVKVKRLHPAAKLPTYAHSPNDGEMGADLYSLEQENILPGEIKLISTGIAIELPPDYGAMVEDRSGLALKGICTLAGLIDSGYRGEVKIILINLSRESHVVRNGDRIAQLRLTKCYPVSFVEANELTPTARGNKGFGSTGQ